MTEAQYKAEYENVVGTDYGSISRKIVRRQIDEGILRGYLAFVDGISIGWCNVNDKANFPIDSFDGEHSHFHAAIEKREKAVVCFEISPEFRGKGVATALLQQAITDAKKEGYIAIESFPVIRDERYEWDSAGPVRLYEKQGFVKVADHNGFVIMRKELI